MLKSIFFFIVAFVLFSAVTWTPGEFKKNLYIRQYFFNPFIMGEGILDIKTMRTILMNKNQTLQPKIFTFIAQAYINEAKKEGVNVDIAFAQMILETNYLNFGGHVSIKENNFSGIGATGNPKDRIHFPTILTGIRAHIQHLKAYSSREKLNEKLLDPRFKYVSRGSAITFFELSGKWAMDPSYGHKIEKILYALYALYIQTNKIRILS